MHSRKWLLFSNNEIWIKKDNPNFDINMGSFDGAKLWILEGGMNFGFYGDDGLSCFENKSGPEQEKKKKKKRRYVKFFEDNDLNITSETNLHITDYLDETFKWKTGKYYSYRKQNKNLQWIHKQSKR